MSALNIKKGSTSHSAYDLRDPNAPVNETHTLAVLVDNESGVLARVIGLFSGRGYNIDSLTVAEVDHEGHLSRITVVTRGTPPVIAQIKAQLDRYPDLAKSIPELADFSRQGNQEWHDFAGRLAKTKDGQVCYNFGKHKGKTVEEVATSEPGYFGWMMDADFPLYTKQLLREEMERIKQKRREKREGENYSASMEDKLAALQNKFKK